jgi:pyruvate/2-oxoglutarate dehydrogenase complex dihydrolipoamide acyltransferase (E2) component
MVRTDRPPTASRNVWGQIGLSACVLLLPPILVGTAVYAMFPVPKDGTASSSSLAVVEFRPAGSELLLGASESSRDAAAPQPAAAAAPPANTAGKPAPPSKPPAAAAYALAGAHSEPAGKDISRVPGPTPVRVTTVVAPNIADVESGQSAAPGHEAAPSQIAAAPDAVPDAEPPSAVRAVPSPESPPKLRVFSLHRVHSYVRQLARRSPARNETRAARWADKPHQAFSLRNWFQQLGGRRGAQRG